MRLTGQIVSTYLELVGDRMERHISVITVEWSKCLDLFLISYARDVLQDAGKITVEIAEAKVES